VDDAAFESQLRIACEAGASGVVVGRSVWAAAATMLPGERDHFLETAGRDRLLRLVKVVEDSGRPWHERTARLSSPAIPGEGWYTEY
jgi:tagatose 1,6-diphosphate aldolase